MNNMHITRPIHLILLTILVWSEIGASLTLAQARPATPVTSALPPTAEPGVMQMQPEEDNLPAPAAQPMSQSPSDSGPSVDAATDDSPFVRHVDLEDGERAAVITAAPHFYRAADGSQQPIDTRFEQSDWGFANVRNLVAIVAEPRRAAMRVGLDALAVEWSPQALLSVTGDQETLLAQPLSDLPEGAASVYDHAIRYTGSWTLAGLSDEILALPGAAEHSVVFAERPPIGEVDSLRLRAFLRLPPGGQLWANDRIQEGAFATASDVEIRPNHGGDPLILSPAFVFEQDSPAIGIAAHYHFQPHDDGWLVTMTTPADWWRDPTRRYPVVWDPKIQVLRPLEFAQRVSAGCRKWDGYVDVGRNEQRTGPVTTSCLYRALLRFTNLNQLTLPPGATIERATLVVVPNDGFVNVRYNTFKEITLNAEVRPVTSGWSHNAAVGWDNNPSVGAPIGSAQRYWRYAASANGPFPGFFTGMRFPIQTGANGLVTDWINGGSNHGLELRAIPSQESSCAGGCNHASIPIGMAWSELDKNFWLDLDASGGGIYETPGVALVIHYRSPALPEGRAYRLDDQAPLPPTHSGAVFNRTFHAYELQPSNGATYTAVGVKGLRRSVIDAAGKQMHGWFSHVQWGSLVEFGGAAAVDAPAATSQSFELPISIADCDACTEDPRSRSPGEPRQGSNFVLMAGNAADGKQVRIHPTGNDRFLERYAVEVARSQPLLPAVDPGQVQTEGFYHEYTFSLATDHLLALRTINLPANSTVLLRLDTNGADYNSAPVQARVFAPGNPVYHKSDSLRPIIDDGGNGASFTVQAGKGGDWAVVIDLPGDITPVRVVEGQCYLSEEQCSSPVVRTIDIRLSLLVCPINAEATVSGCKFHYKPTPGVTPVKRVNVSGGGYYLVYHAAGFVACAADECTPASSRWVTYITWQGNLDRMVTVAGGVVRVNVRNPHLRGEAINRPRGREEPFFLLGKANNDAANPVYPRQMIWIGSTLASVTSPIIGKRCDNNCPDLPLHGPDAQTYQNGKYLEFSIDVRAQTAKGEGRMTRPLLLTNGSVTELKLNVAWEVRAEGYRGMPTSPPGADGPLRPSAVSVGGIVHTRIAGMSYYFSGAFAVHYDETRGYFTTIRNDNGHIHQDFALGGAWTIVDYLILPFGVAPNGSDGVQLCAATGGFCGDIRDAADSWEQPRRNWKMPDILVTGSAQTVVYSADGQVQVFSTDHPSASDQANTNVGFSYKSFGARVEISDDICPGSSNPQRVQVIKGSSKIKLPGIGSEVDSSSAINADFVLCEGKLRRVSLKFDARPHGIPMAQPPVMYLNSIAGIVTIDPAYTTIQIDVGFFIGDPASPVKLYRGAGKVTIDTRGLFDMQTTGKILGMMDAEGQLWVAWNPLDVGMAAAGYLPGKSDWLLSGFYYAHVWRGRGWQGRYHWLPDDNAFHMTASIQATFRIPKGLIIDAWPIVVPPGDIGIGVELSFGQFCANANCSRYQWGIKGVVKIAGFSVGAYVNLDCDLLVTAAIAPPLVLLCTKFIIGSDGHVLIDQYGGGGPPFPLAAEARGATAMVSVSGEPAAVNHRTVHDPMAANVDEPFTVNVSTGSFMVALGWVRGAPRLSLVQPNGVVITPANAQSHGAEVTTTVNMLMFGVNAPMPGQWLARVEDASPDADYRIAFFANKMTPALTFTKPVVTENVAASGNGVQSQYYRIRWTPPAASADLRLSLYYAVTDGTALTNSQPSGGVIVENIDPGVGFYDWDLSFHSRGEYQIYATLQDRAGADVSPTGENQYVGVRRSDAPGKLVYSDAQGPPPIDPTSVTFSPLEDGLKMCWEVSPAHDLMGYVVRYHVFGNPNTGGFGTAFSERVLADVPYSPGARQCMRIGGLTPGGSTVAFPNQSYGVVVFDATLNESTVARPASGSAVFPADETQPPALMLSGVANRDGSITVTWPYTEASSYELFYAVEAPAGPWQEARGAVEGPSPITVGDLTFNGSYTLRGLTPGRWHAFSVRWYRRGPNPPPSLLSNQLWLLVSRSDDSNGDGCPDDWHAAHELADGNGDRDRDGLVNVEECKRGTNPHHPDTDGDGWSDGDEVLHGTNPLDPFSHPGLSAEGNLLLPRPRLALAANTLSFHAFTQGPNPAAQSVAILNLGGGSLAVSASTDAPWIQPSVAGDSLIVAINKSGLARGQHTGTVRISAGNGAAGSPQTVFIHLQMLAGTAANADVGATIYLPLVANSALAHR